MFGAEAEERLQAMNRELLMLEGTTDDSAAQPRLEALFRDAHSLKGAARAVTAERVEIVAHWLETLIERMRDGELAPEPAVCDRIYQTLDALGKLVREATGDEPAEIDLESLSRILDDPAPGPVVPRLEELPEEPEAPNRDVAQRPSTPEIPLPTPAAPAAASPSPPKSPPSSEMVRVPTAKLDALLADVGELAVAQASSQRELSRLRMLTEELAGWEAATRSRRAGQRQGGSKLSITEPAGMSLADWERLQDTRANAVDIHRALETASRRVAQATAELEDEIRWTRMFPVSLILDSFPRMVRDIARDQGKQVELVLAGAEAEVDRSLLEELRAPLTHVLRNSIDHGIEPPDERRAAGKPSRGTISISAYQQAGTLLVEVTDDGAGINLERVRAKAVDRGLVTQDTADRMSDAEALGLIYRSGFSTAPMITDLSGRGVGLDVVREHVERLHGMIEVDATPGEGTRFKFVLPLSVSTTPCLFVAVATQTFALPLTNVSRILRVAKGEIEYVQGAAVVRDKEGIVAVSDLADVLSIERDSIHQLKDPTPVILLGSADRRMALLVDELIDLQAVISKSLPPPFYRVRNVSGATILGTGAVVTILNAAHLIRAAAPPREGEPAASAVPTRAPVVLLVEDSITTRALQKQILESAGYEVHTVNDGLEAWGVLQQGAIDVVVTDVYMSGMDGFELTAKVRSDERLAQLPVVLVTSKDSRSHRERGAEVGANAYIVKGSVEQRNLVDAVSRVL
jgi:two-component system chemotaxis sensor kinase CheA